MNKLFSFEILRARARTLKIGIRKTEIILFFKKKSKYLVISKKSSTFAADLDGYEL